MLRLSRIPYIFLFFLMVTHAVIMVDRQGKMTKLPGPGNETTAACAAGDVPTAAGYVATEPTHTPRRPTQQQQPHFGQ